MCQASTWTSEQVEFLQYAVTSIKSMICFCCTWPAKPWEESTAFSNIFLTLPAEWCSLKGTNIPIENMNGNMFWMGLPNCCLTSLFSERFKCFQLFSSFHKFTGVSLSWLHVWLQIHTTLGGRVAGFSRQPCRLRPLPLPFLGSIGRRVWRPVATAARGLGQGKTLRCLGESLYIQSWHLEVPRYNTMLGDRHSRWWMVVICMRNCIYFRSLQVCTSFRWTDVFSCFFFISNKLAFPDPHRLNLANQIYT